MVTRKNRMKIIICEYCSHHCDVYVCLDVCVCVCVYRYSNFMNLLNTAIHTYTCIQNKYIYEINIYFSKMHPLSIRVARIFNGCTMCDANRSFTAICVVFYKNTLYPLQLLSTPKTSGF